MTSSILTCWYSTSIQVKACWEFVVETAFRLRDLLVQEGLDSWPKTTGGKGLHIMVPIKAEMAWNTAHEYTREIAELLAATAPGKYTTSAAFSARPGKLFIDYLRNGRGTTTVGAYSPRARPGFPVAAPVTWREVATEFVLVILRWPIHLGGPDAGDQAS
jgi:bifunctional non-homologous end joining protein LigD